MAEQIIPADPPGGSNEDYVKAYPQSNSLGWADAINTSKKVGNQFSHTNWDKFEKEARSSENVETQPTQGGHINRAADSASKWLQEKTYTPKD